MKLKKLLLPLLMVPLIATSCSSGPAPDTEEIDTDYYFIFGNNMDTKAHFTYSNDYFRESPTKFNKDFALMSFVATANSGQKKEAKKFYNAIHFNHHYYTEVYDKGCGTDTYGFYIADREVDDFTVVALSFRSYDYTQEWVSNVTLGKEGNHEGFEYSANNAIVEFNDYMAKNYANKKVKLWINGFSRGGALANMFATKLLNDNSFGFTQENMYCYTFEAPACFSEENVRYDYKNIWNLSNSGDVVVNVPPREYGLYRSGTDIDILRDDFDKLFADYMYELYPAETYPKDSSGNDIPYDQLTDDQKHKTAKCWIDTVPAFKDSKKYKNETEFMQVFVSRILAADDPTFGIQDREHYVMHVQTAARFMTELFFSIDQYALFYIMEDFQKRWMDTPAQMLKLASKVVSEGGLYEIAQPYLKFVSYEFDEEDLKTTCNTFYNVLMHLDFGDVMSLAGALSNIQRALYFHWHESSYVLLRALEYNPEA